MVRQYVALRFFEGSIEYPSGAHKRVYRRNTNQDIDVTKLGGVSSTRFCNAAVSPMCGDDHSSEVRRIGAESALMLSATVWQASAFREEITTLAPWAARASAMAPIPSRTGDDGVLSGQIKERSSCERHEGFLLCDCEA